ncbi:multidrug resistance-associated protein 1-like isoform X2 [Tubulanus polymorphus]
MLIDIITARSLIIEAQQKGEIVDVYRFSIFFVHFGLVILQFVLVLVVDPGANRAQMGYYTNRTGERQPLLSQTTDRKITKPCPELTASFLSKITFTWITGLMIKGYRKSLMFADLWALRPSDQTKNIYRRFEQDWNREKQKYSKVAPTYRFKPTQVMANGSEQYTSYSKMETAGTRIYKTGTPSLFKTYSRVFGAKFYTAGIFKLVFDAINLIQPQVLSAVITFVDKDDNSYMWQGYVLAVAMFLLACVKTIFGQLHFDGCYVTGMRLRGSIIAAVYRKALILSNSAKKTSTQGEIVNLMAVDSQKLQDIPNYLHLVWSAPLTVVVALVLLYQELGASAFAGLGVIVLLIPINAYIASKARKLQVGQMIHKDSRLKTMNEVLNGMKILKLYAWEPSFDEKISGIRDREIKMLRAAAYLNAFSSITWFIAPYLVALASFAVFTMSSPENILTPNKAFVSLSYFNVMNYPMTLLPMSIAMLVQANVSINRVHKFLTADELDENTVCHDKSAKHPISVKDGYFSWDKDEPDNLRNINIDIEDGSLVAVVGTVGCGKSSLISAFLGDMYKTAGSVNVRGSIAYVPQQAWLLNATLENNILFSKDMNRTKYENVIHACALTPDLKILPGGDQTEIGDKGINLSGGQKQRVSLARAVYQSSEIYLLDDPLSAVDSHVGKHIFEKVISNDGLLAGKTRILVTHGLSYLPRVDQIIVLKDGEVSEYGTYQELLGHDGAFAEFVKTFLQQQDEEGESDSDPEDVEIKRDLRRRISHISGGESGLESASDIGAASASNISGTEDGRVRRRRRRTKKDRDAASEDTVKPIKNTRLTVDETEETGQVKGAIYLAYIRSMGMMVFVCLIITYLLYIAGNIGTNIWLAYWSNDALDKNSTDEERDQLLDLRLGVYGAFGVANALFIFMQSLSIAVGSISASVYLHKRILQRLLKAPMSFYDTTPLGRILNRVSKDIDIVDINIPLMFRIFLATLAQVISTLVIIMISTWQFVIALVPLIILYYFAQRFYIRTSRQLKRIDSVRRSPIYSHFGTTLAGVSSIRAYNQDERFIKMSDELVDENQMAWYPNIVSNRWLGICLESVGNLVILFAAVFAVLSKGSQISGLLGLSVTYALQVTGSLNFMVRCFCDLETYTVSVERIIEYTRIRSEADWVKPYRRTPDSWPEQGRVEFKDYSVRYRPGLDLVLKDVNAIVEPGEKVGIVGRTGAGKSSLTLGLFRIIEAAGGSIIIDGQTISRLGLHDLRNGLTIIPQEPVLFSGSLRSNLDPFDRYGDDQLWKALEMSHLRSFVKGSTGQLEYICSEGGENLSVGQRQLLCLARALLRKSKILVLDEATAAVDLETDDLIQTTIRKIFDDCTVLTIAHRLNTIMDYDKVMVLDKGRIKEFDEPKNLLNDKRTIFYGMARDAGLV